VSWSPGDTIVLQEVLGDRVWGARPMTVVRDDGDFLVLWFPRGTVWKAHATPPHRVRGENRGERMAACASLGDWVFQDSVWDVDTLSLTRAGDWHSVWVSWPRDGREWGWYVNLQQPFRRTALGIETMDLMLDVIIARDRTWRWKDEDELDEFVTRGVFDDRLVARIRAEGERVIHRALRDEPPFNEPWRDWRANTSWTIPTLPEGWDRRCR
jgi:predicted RNA-binding protein associated with RNAse of E/G family